MACGFLYFFLQQKRMMTLLVTILFAVASAKLYLLQTKHVEQKKLVSLQ